jgi:Ca2+-binding EF-hand superfamily protein
MVTNLGSMSSLFASSYYGIQNAYQLALSEGSTGVTRDTLMSSGSKYAMYNPTASSFSSYMLTNFKNLDKDKNGTLSSTEMSNMITSMSEKGLSYQELMTAASSSGISTNDLNTVLSNFRKIDKNGDGRVSQAEINYFIANKQINDKITELKNRTSSNISLFSDSTSSDSTTSTTSSTGITSIL